MSYNGSGTFQINTSGQPVVTGTIISSTAFNALTADLATGLSTAITKDGQTSTTARIPFAQGINSSLATDTSSGSTGSIYTAGGIGITKGLFVGGTATFSATPIFSALTASSAVATDASKNLVSVTNTGTGNNVLATSPTITTPTISTITSAAATSLTLQSAGTTGVTVDTSQNVGIGTSSPSNYSKLAVLGSNNTSFTGITSINSNTSTGTAGIQFSSDSTYIKAAIGLLRSDPNGKGALVFYNDTNADAANWATTDEKMRIDSSGNLLVNITSNNASTPIAYFNSTGASADGIWVANTNTSAATAVLWNKATSGNNVFQNFGTEGTITTRGSISYNRAGGLVAYNTTSDYRAKTVKGTVENALAKVALLKPSTGRMNGASIDIEFFVAHELQEIVPSAVTGEKDAVNEDGSPAYQMVDKSAIIPLLTAAIQEQQALIISLTARIAALEA